jgi:type III pantothenate kinase
MKSARFILVDVSNSWTKYCLSDGKRLGTRHSLPTPGLDLKTARAMRSLAPAAKLVVCCVVPQKQKILFKIWPAAQREWVSFRSPLGITIDYPQPSRIGADRLANAVAAASLYKLPAVVIDFGTAVTFDIVSGDRAYLGGVIAPGLNAMTDYLHERTALLPRLKLREPRRFIAKSTVEAMRVGAVAGYRGLVREILSGIRQELPLPLHSIVATGGQGELVASRVSEIQKVNPLLTLQGLQIIATNRWP